MNDEQFTQLMGKLSRIIELLEKEQQPKSYSMINDRGLPNHHTINVDIQSPLNPTQLIEAIGKHLPPPPPEDPSAPSPMYKR